MIFIAIFDRHFYKFSHSAIGNRHSAALTLPSNTALYIR
jgi:hypothetical protein